MIAMIDNYDSFTWNLIQMLGVFHPDLQVFRNDELCAAELSALNPDGIVISPGPGRPEDAGNTLSILEHFIGKVPILGICLGHQAICHVYGATITYAKSLFHGKRSAIAFDESCPLFEDVLSPCLVGRYHSLAAARSTLPSSLKVIAETEDGEIMGVMDPENHVYGLQFHPESILTEQGAAMLHSFVNLVLAHSAGMESERMN